MQIGFVGLGKMGKGLALHLHEQNVQVIAWNRSPEPRAEVEHVGVLTVENLIDLPAKLVTPRVIWLMLPAGEVTDQTVSTLLPHLAAGDVLIDGSNSYYEDSKRRADLIAEKEINYVDVGVSGGPAGARNGACLMIGGKKEVVETLLPLFQLVAVPGAVGYFGDVGAGHFAKMVHNGIEYGMMQSIAEGAAVLKASEYQFDLAEVFRIYNTKSVIESRLVGWTQEALVEDPDLTNTTSKIAHTGEGEWTINTAKKLNVEVPAIKAAFNVRLQSTEESESFRDKVVSAMRGKFGGHAVKKND